MARLLEMKSAENAAAVNKMAARLGADVGKKARMVGKSSNHAFAGILCPSLAGLVVYRL